VLHKSAFTLPYLTYHLERSCTHLSAEIKLLEVEHKARFVLVELMHIARWQEMVDCHYEK